MVCWVDQVAQQPCCWSQARKKEEGCGIGLATHPSQKQNITEILTRLPRLNGKVKENWTIWTRRDRILNQQNDKEELNGL